MKRALRLSALLGLVNFSMAIADEETIASAESAAPDIVTADATIKALDGTVLRQGINGYTCYPQQTTIGPMCNEPVWDRLISAMTNKRVFQPGRAGQVVY